MRRMTKLMEYLRREGLSFAEFGRRSGTKHARTIERIAKGQRDPSHRLMRRMIDASNGGLTANDFFPAHEE